MVKRLVVFLTAAIALLFVLSACSASRDASELNKFYVSQFGTSAGMDVSYILTGAPQVGSSAEYVVSILGSPSFSRDYRCGVSTCTAIGYRYFPPGRVAGLVFEARGGVVESIKVFDALR